MSIHTFCTVGVGPGDPELITIKAINALKQSDLIVIPLSAKERESVAEGIIDEYVSGVPKLRLVFPMTRDAADRDGQLEAQLKENRAAWESARRVTMPVIGDAALYATSAYLFEVWRRLVPSLSLEIVPGISAHAAVSARAGRFLALGDDILTIIPGTAGAASVERALSASDAAAVFKPIALRGELRSVAVKVGPWRAILRADRAGLPDERILWGDEALETPDEYLSTLMLWR